MRPGILLVVVAMLWPATNAALSPAAPQGSPTPQTPAAAPPRHPSYDKLQMFVGHWTIEGRENSYIEKCDWFDGRFTFRSESSTDGGPWTVDGTMLYKQMR